MTTVTPTSNGAGISPGVSGSAAQQQTTLNSDFQTFLQMLTVQMQNQDPLNPVDSAEYSAQLAAFSSVEQQVLTNNLLSALTAQMSTSGLAQLSNWVGMDARSSAPVEFDGTPIELHPLPATLADEAYLVVRDRDGNEVQRIEIGLDGEAVEWAGVVDGAPVETGIYSFEVENLANGEALGATPVEAYQSIEEAQMIDGEVILILEGGQAIRPSNVIALRDA